MFIPPKDFLKKPETNLVSSAPVSLRSSHLLLSYQIVSEFFSNLDNVYVVFNAEQKTLALSSQIDEASKKKNKASQLILKDKNLKGDKSIALHEILIDNQLDESDRELEYEIINTNSPQVIVKL